jgi:N-acetyl-gamma-glutamylphosphate reductase
MLQAINMKRTKYELANHIHVKNIEQQAEKKEPYIPLSPMCVTFDE